MPVETRGKHWVKGHYRKHKKGHSARVAKANEAKRIARHKRAAKLKALRKRK